MAEQSFDEKTEKATPRRKQEARKKGEVAKSRELPSVAVLLSALIVLTISVSFMYHQIQTVMKNAISLIPMKELGIPEFLAFAEKTIGMFIITVAPLFVAVFITAIFSNIVQVGFMLSVESMKPKFSKLNPIKGFGRLFSKQSFMELFKSLSKLAIIGGVAFLTVREEMKNVHHLGELELNVTIAYIFLTIFKIFVRCTLAMIVLVVIDFAFQKWDFEKRMRMSKKEVKDEFKTTEGDPLVKSRIRSVQMEMARRRMMQAVPEADVVITNPTHIAVALKYDSSLMRAPKVLAKGAGKIAERIKALAEQHNIPIVENKPLARNLYALVEIDREIPTNLYQAVADVLAYVYKLKGHKAFAG